MCQQPLESLVEVAVEACAWTDAGHLAGRIELVVFHPIDTEALQTSLFVQVADSVAVVERFDAGHRQVSAPLLLHRAHLLAQRFGRVGRENIRVAALQEVVGEPTAEALLQLRLEGIAAAARRGTAVFRPTAVDGIQPLAVGCGDILHIRDLLQASFNLQRRDACI